jgi:hypothetical protein
MLIFSNGCYEPGSWEDTRELDSEMTRLMQMLKGQDCVQISKVTGGTY